LYAASPNDGEYTKYYRAAAKCGCTGFTCKRGKKVVDAVQTSNWCCSTNHASCHIVKQDALISNLSSRRFLLRRIEWCAQRLFCDSQPTARLGELCCSCPVQAETHSARFAVKVLAK